MNESSIGPVARAKALSTIKARQLNLSALEIHESAAKRDPFAKVARGYVAMGLYMDRVEQRLDRMLSARGAA